MQVRRQIQGGCFTQNQKLQSLDLFLQPVLHPAFLQNSQNQRPYAGVAKVGKSIKDLEQLQAHLLRLGLLKRESANLENAHIH